MPVSRPASDRRHLTRLIAALVAALAWCPWGARGGEWHRLSTLHCSDCHTMHDSSGGLTMQYDSNPAPADKLLRARTANQLCLSCHSGQVAIAPNVTAPSDQDPPGGGFPPDLTDPNHQAHALTDASVVPPQGDTAVVLGCITCHDPHGNGRYRNLRPSPSGTGRAAGVTLTVSQTVAANGSNAADVYLRSNVLYRQGMSEWCMDCHNLSPSQHTNPAHLPEASLATAANVDMTHWAGPITNRVPVENPTDTAVPSNDDQVFCLSCHKAHGSPHVSAEIWADYPTGDLNNTCQQCHPM